MPELGWVRAQSQGRRGPGPPERQEGWPGHEVSSVSLAEPALWPGPSARERSVQGGWPCTRPSSWPQRPRPPGDSPPRFHTSARPQPQPTGQEPCPRLSLHVRPSERNSDVRPRTQAEGRGFRAGGGRCGLCGLSRRPPEPGCPGRQATAAATHASCGHRGDGHPAVREAGEAERGSRLGALALGGSRL